MLVFAVSRHGKVATDSARKMNTEPIKYCLAAVTQATRTNTVSLSPSKRRDSTDLKNDGAVFVLSNENVSKRQEMRGKWRGSIYDKEATFLY